MPRGYARYVLAVMVAINFLNFADRWVASAAAPLIQREFHLDDFRVGLLGTAFLLVYGVAAIPFGIWADRGVRRVVIGVGVLLWSCATVVSGLVANYAQLLASRSFLGIGEAGYYPAGNSLLGDYFPKEALGRAMSVWNAGSALGIAVGFAGGGAVASAFGWRTAFFFAAAPGLVLALLAFTLREPRRGAAEKVGPRLRPARPASLDSFRELAGIRTLRATILARTVLFFVLASAAYWLPTALGRRFGMSVTTAGTGAGSGRKGVATDLAITLARERKPGPPTCYPHGGPPRRKRRRSRSGSRDSKHRSAVSIALRDSAPCRGPCGSLKPARCGASS